MNKHHFFIHGGNPQTLCGIKMRDGIIFDQRIYVNCKKCLKKLKIYGKKKTK